ncbi:unnamed protein product [Paramecium sonneborni]|uniref:Uncharacterized protein n=1 Tax=Paramecium sonneborni TaxID=65129 RepID=A0A8S1L3X1_9CILI|nr:unnamed protein product [Paramecium sonneborni]
MNFRNLFDQICLQFQLTVDNELQSSMNKKIQNQNNPLILPSMDINLTIFPLNEQTKRKSLQLSMIQIVIFQNQRQFAMSTILKYRLINKDQLLIIIQMIRRQHKHTYIWSTLYLKKT